jgi:hypothetical protein
VRHYAWLSAGWADQGKDAQWRSRADRLGVDIESAEMPPTVGAEWLLGWLFQAGPIASNGMGVSGLTWTELQAWRDVTGAWADDWEMTTLHALSAAYADAHHRSSKPEREPYWSADDVREAQAQKSEQAGATLASIFSGMSRRQHGQGV